MTVRSPAAGYPRPEPGVHVEHYDLDLRYRVATNRLAGRATLTVDLRGDVQDLRLGLHRLRVGRVEVDGVRVGHTHRDGRLTVRLPRGAAAAGRCSVAVEYAGTPVPVASPWGPLGWEELTDGALAANQPTGAPSWFPCHDDPADKATYRTAVTVDQPYRALAHGRLVSQVRRAASTTFVYEEPAPTSTYLATVHVGRYELHELVAQRVPQLVAVTPAHAREARLALADHDAIMTHHEAVFGPYPLAGYTLVVTPDPLDIPLEAQGIGVFGHNHLTGPDRRLIPHELAHQWFGNAVSVAGWQHIWLNEGPACYAEWLWAAASGGPAVTEAARTWHARLRRAPQDLVLADPGYPRIFDDRVYKRGALALHALDRVLGRESFAAMLGAWTAGHSGGAVTTDDFRDHVVAHAGGARGERVGALLDDWVMRPELPDLPG